ncbi:MFS transporter [Acidaminobacter hydrogenoformans]|uniref:Na+/melibiose symporter n=1 Tax=Acidaminobacter hydrogenoformans DSM 2784 TaxID=1120920 RepID=A0A1G5RXK4_9FIRM|nr:MFS transporter [Acidaminobacter hydrogenoformans]SCZ78588.1 Na+/melibiose symporter [Acidaminobacter hydrogenoformans DSM 2784]
MDKLKRTSPAMKVILLFGIISLLGDLVYEGARSANSQYFTLIGVSAAQIGLVFGLGEFLGYMLRLFAGIFSDKTGRHWAFMFAGYGMLLSVPLLGLTQNWNAIVVLVLMERIGKALRNPAKDTVLSGVASGAGARKNASVGIGLAFGIQEALDQLGAFGGPLIFTMVFFLVGDSPAPNDYQLGYRLLAIPFVLLLLFLSFARREVERAQLLPEPSQTRQPNGQPLQPVFWVYTAFTFFATIGLVNFSVVGYHLKSQGLFADGHITLLYAAAMAVDALTALISGREYDRLKRRRGAKSGGLMLLGVIPIATLALPWLTLSHVHWQIILGMLIFGGILGLHETIMRSAIADMTPYNKRGTGYGIFNAGYGLALLGGAALMGWFYDLGRTDWIVTLAITAELVAMVVFFKLKAIAGR